MSDTRVSDLCLEVEDNLASVLDGSASAALYDHIADCDACRDRKHDATLAAQHVAIAGFDFRAPEGFAERLLAGLEAARPTGEPAPRTSGVTASEPRTSSASAPISATAVLPDAIVAPRGAVASPEMVNAPTHHVNKTIPLPVFEASRAAALQAQQPQPAPQPMAASPTRVSASVDVPAPAPPPALTAPTLEESHRAPPEPVAASPSVDAPRVDSRHEHAAPATPTPAHVDTRPRVEAPKVTPIGAAPAKRSLKRPVFFTALVGAMAAAAAVGFWWKGHGKEDKTTAQVNGPWSGQVSWVSRASADKTGGLEVCNLKQQCNVVEKGAEVKAGWTVRTDARTRVRVMLADGTELAIDRASEIELTKDTARAATVKQGTLVADVEHVDGQTAHVAFPHGDVEVVGTKLSVTASEDRASVQVARGTVRVTGDGGKATEVRAGEEATIVRGSDPVVASTSSIADTMEWSDKTPEEVDSPVLRGLGELRARKPGDTKEKDHAVRLAKHAAKVRIVDVVARTEVDETFSNDTDEELEGIFRFPLPPGAQIEGLKLEVDGKLIEGAFVDRDRGAAIWRGVIQNAAPKAPRPREEIIWVPGPWRDPALLEWQRGGRFELKIFPIPKRGSRRVLLTYTQTVDQSAGIRRFTYPLAHDGSGSTKIDAFDLDVQVLGGDKAVPISTRGYQLASASGGDGDRRTFHADGFVPAGDLTVEYALPDREKEVTAWAYQAAAVPPATTTIATATPANGKPKTDEQKQAEATAQAILTDNSPYVAIALRPKLPRWAEAKERVHVIVVDASRSMFGERFARATHLASGIVREMDRRDSFVLLACDTVCRPMTAESGGSPRPQAPGASAAGDVEKFLGTIEPDGGSDVAASIAAARAAVGAVGTKELRILYLGDGTPTVGPTRSAHLETAVRHALPSGEASVVAVALGADADMTSLGALARGGGGVVVPYVPGQKVSTAALEVLGAAYGVMLRDPEVELPAGLSQVTPSKLDPIRAGGETILVARMTGGDISGGLKLRGKVAGERFEQTYPVKIVSTTNVGNAFVPRLYAAAKIAELERQGSDSAKPTIIELSKRFAVASRFTSMLVLESEAMFKAFGVDRTSGTSSFTGEVGAEHSAGNSEAKPDEEEQAAADAKDEGGVAGGTLGFGSGHAAGGKGAPSKKSASLSDPFDGDAPKAKEEARADKSPAPSQPRSAAPDDAVFSSPPSPAATMSPQQQVAGEPPRVAAKPSNGPGRWRPPPPPPRRFVAMRKVFDRKVSFDVVNSVAQQNAAKLAGAEQAHASQPDSRDKTVDLFALYSTSGRVGDAQELTAKWAGKDALDPDALQARADLAARQGDRARSIRILSGLADLRPNDRAIQTRLAEAQEAAGNRALACEHRIALADMAQGEAKLVADAVRCARETGFSDLASQIQLDAGDKVRAAVDVILNQAAPTNVVTLKGDVQLSAVWQGNADVDIALIDPQGKRTSWFGSTTRASISSLNPTSTHDESLGLTNLPQGNYVIEVSRSTGGDVGEVVRGDVTIRMPGGESRKVPFTLTGARAEVGTVKVFFTARLVPVNPWDF